MSLASGFQIQRIPFNAIDNIQPSGVWAGSATELTTLDKGVYFANWNVSYQVNGAGPITNTQTVITMNDPYLSGGIIAASTPLTGQMGLSGAQPMKQTVTNTFIVSQNNTPIYVYMNCVLTSGTWGTTNFNEQYLNFISFVKISSL